MDERIYVPVSKEALRRITKIAHKEDKGKARIASILIEEALLWRDEGLEIEDKFRVLKSDY